MICLTKKVNILKHTLVPEHTVLSAENKQKLLKKYNISESQLPIISIKDPVAKILNVKAGDVLKIKRKGPSGAYLYFRRVSE